MTFEADLHDLLEATADRFDPDPAVLADAEKRADAMVRARRWRWGIAAAAVLGVLAFVGTSLARGPSAQPLEIIDQPPSRHTTGATETSDSSVADAVPVLTLADDGSIRGLSDAPDHGVLVQAGGQVVVVGLDGTVAGVLEGALVGPETGQLGEDVAMPGQRSRSRLPAVVLPGDDEVVWLDPAEGTWQPAAQAPLQGLGRVERQDTAAPDEQMQLFGAGQGPEPEVIATWPRDESWWLSSDHRVVTWRSCWDDHECPNTFYDADNGGQGELAPGCWIANAVGDLSLTEICNGTVVATSLGPDRTEHLVAQATDAQGAVAVAAFDGGIVRVDHATCDVVEPMRVVDEGGLVPLLGDDSASNPSAVPLGTTSEGGVVLHFNTAGCGATDEAPGVYVVDPTTGDRRLVHEVAVGPGQVQMWGPTNPVTPTTSADGPSQPRDEAARDGVLPAVAALTFDQRVEVRDPSAGAAPTRVETDQGVWVVSHMPVDTTDLSGGCGLGATDDPDAVYRRDTICTVEYGEVLLLDHDEQRILRAFPLPGFPPQRLTVTDDAVWCGKVGDGGLPDSMLCRIDRQTYDWQVRVFPHESWEQRLRSGDARSGIDPATGELWLPDHWVVDDGAVPHDPRVLGGAWRVDEDGVLVVDPQLHLEDDTPVRYGPQDLAPLPR